MRTAVFLDRDGTLIEHIHHLTDPADVHLVEGGGRAVASLRAAGFACVVVTNQSVVGRGMLDEAGLARVHEVLRRQLADAGTQLDGLYWCPVRPVGDDPTVIEDPDRKPGPGMLQRAARELDLDLARSWMVGDAISDMLAGRNAGCRATVLVRTGHGERVDASHPAVDHVASDLPSAVALILRAARGRG
jgi:D-glycero-D-manno-heptose 1,7-bisphosphate phosphatase